MFHNDSEYQLQTLVSYERVMPLSNEYTLYISKGEGRFRSALLCHIYNVF